MPGHALHVALNYCNPYDFAQCELDGAIPDGRALLDFTDDAGFKRVGKGLLVDEDATAEKIKAALQEAAQAPARGDLLIVTFSGLGAVPDLSLEATEIRDRRGWVGADGRILTINTILATLSTANADANVLVISACCFVGPEITVTPAAAVAASRTPLRVASPRLFRSLREMNMAVRTAKSVLTEAGKATVYHLAAGGGGDLIPDGTSTERSPFVRELIALLRGPARTFPQLLGDLRDRLDPEPQLERLQGVNAAFEAAGPYVQNASDSAVSERLSA